MKEYYKQEFLEEIVKKSYSISDVARHLGLVTKGSNFKTIRKYIDKYNIDTSHFTGMLWSKGLKYINKTSRIPLNEILKENTNFSSTALKHRLIFEGIKEYKCEECGISTWNNKEITLELHHINGNHYDNRLENLIILCPNCHSQTSTWKRSTNNVIKPKNFKKGYDKICPICNTEFKSDKKSRIYCSRKCYNQSLKIYDIKNTISKDDIINNIDNFTTITDLAEFYGISRPNMRNILIRYNLLEEFKQKYDFKAIPIVQYDIDGNKIKEWPSITDAEETLNIKSISKCLKLQRKSAGGFIWRYKKNGEE